MNNILCRNRKHKQNITKLEKRQTKQPLKQNVKIETNKTLNQKPPTKHFKQKNINLNLKTNKPKQVLLLQNKLQKEHKLNFKNTNKT